MQNPFLSSRNPVLDRELRASLRHVRTFGLLAIYVSILAAVVVSAFPSDQNIAMEGGTSQVGRELFYKFFLAQSLLVLLLFPALATGAVAQERERRTLEPLLMTPLRPMQIVWGKASGVLALAVLLLAGTLPLTSMCFLLGGLSPGELIASYAILFGLALFTTGVGLYCASRWVDATRATLYCYMQLPPLLGVVLLFLPPGSLVSGLVLCSQIVGYIVNLCRSFETASVPQRFRLAVRLLFIIAAIAASLWFLTYMFQNTDLGVVIVGVLFVTSYLVYVAQFGIEQAAREIVQRAEPRRPTREVLHDVGLEVQRALAPPSDIYLPVPTGAYTYTPQVEMKPAKPLPPSYGVEPFLSDYLNPVFAKDMRAGLLGKFDYLLRFSYIAIIGAELLLLCLLIFNPGISDEDVRRTFAGWAQLHLMLVMTFGAWFGARAFAPEREQQTLVQLLTLPLPSGAIVRGKMLAAMVSTLYIFMLGAPLALMLPGLNLLPWRTGLGLLVVEYACGACAVAWGLYCSLFGVTVRRAMGWAIGGILSLVMAHILFVGGFLQEQIASLNTTYDPLSALWLTGAAGFSPFFAASAIAAPPDTHAAMPLAGFAWAAVVIFGSGTLLFLMLTGFSFNRYARTV